MFMEIENEDVLEKMKNVKTTVEKDISESEEKKK